MIVLRLYEILVPTHSTYGDEFTDEFHKEWDKKVCEITGGLTLLKPVKGKWVGSDGTVKEGMIPVRLAMEPGDIETIAKLTKEHYKQEAVMIYMISSSVQIF